MFDIDALIRAWALDKFTNGHPWVKTDDDRHLQQCISTVAEPESFGWECCCYSEYTRDDSFATSFIISCGCGIRVTFRTYESEWNLPNFFKELDEFRENFTCDYSFLDEEY